MPGECVNTPWRRCVCSSSGHGARGLPAEGCADLRVTGQSLRPLQRCTGGCLAYPSAATGASPAPSRGPALPRLGKVGLGARPVLAAATGCKGTNSTRWRGPGRELWVQQWKSVRMYEQDSIAPPQRPRLRSSVGSHVFSARFSGVVSPT